MTWECTLCPPEYDEKPTQERPVMTVSESACPSPRARGEQRGGRIRRSAAHVAVSSHNGNKHRSLQESKPMRFAIAYVSFATSLSLFLPNSYSAQLEVRNATQDAGGSGNGSTSFRLSAVSVGEPLASAAVASSAFSASIGFVTAVSVAVVPDSDGDGILDDGDGTGVPGDNPCTGGNIATCDDNCPGTINSDQQDLDGDLAGDACDPDDDGDGVEDGADNCPLAHNPGQCDDSNPCTDDSCDAAGDCVHAANTVTCDDGDACTTADSCANGACIAGPALSCDDGNACSSDFCQPSVGCVHSYALTATCADGDSCTADLCASTGCEHAPPACTGSSACSPGLSAPGLSVQAVSAAAPQPAESATGLTFSDEAVDVYYGVVAAREGSCDALFMCFPDPMCWGNVEASGTTVTISADYTGPACVFCGCSCVEAEALLTGIVRVVLYVDPMTGLPLSKYQGGQPVVENIPPGARLEWSPSGAHPAVDACISSYCDAYYPNQCLAFAGLAVGDVTVVEQQERPVCDFGFDAIGSTPLSGNGAAFIGAIYAQGTHCTTASASITLDGTSVWVPASTVWPDVAGGNLTDTNVRRKVTVINASATSWEELELKVFNRLGQEVESVLIGRLDPLHQVEWVVEGIEKDASLTMKAVSGSSTIHPLRTPELLAYAQPSPLEPHVILMGSDGSGAVVGLVEHGTGGYRRARPGELHVTLETSEEPGWQTIAAPVSLNNTDEFDCSPPGLFWAVENPSSPASSVTTLDRAGHLRIVAGAAGEGADFWMGSNMRAPRLFQNVGGDWVLETKMEFSPTDDYEGAGVLVDGQRLVERAFSPGAGGQVVRAVGNFTVFAGTTTYIRLVKVGTVLSGYWSADGVTWQFGGSATMDPTSVGLFAVRKDWDGANNHDAIADFDYFRFISSCLPFEACDGVDNDCNGSIDDGLAGSTCGIGACQQLADACVEGVPQACVPDAPSPEICDGVDDDCNGSVLVGEIDIDGDGSFVCGGDCDDADDSRYTGASERNDGTDDQCPGESGYGLRDEISGTSGFFSSSDPSSYCWPPQPGAAVYEVVRSTTPGFPGPCQSWRITNACLQDYENPEAGVVYFYLVRAFGPNAGSWGRDSSLQERLDVCQ